MPRVPHETARVVRRCVQELTQALGPFPAHSAVYVASAARTAILNALLACPDQWLVTDAIEALSHVGWEDITDGGSND